MATLIQVRRDTAANWASVNPVLAQGEIGLEIDTGNFKFGNTAGDEWNALPYAGAGGGGGATNFLMLTDTPASYAGFDGYFLKVNSTSIEFGQANGDEVQFDNAASGLAATHVQAAINELMAEKEAALGNPASDGYLLSSTAAGVRSWVPPSVGGSDDQTAAEVSYTNTTSGLAATHVQAAIDEVVAEKEPVLGNPGTNGYVLASTTSGVRSWVPPGGADDQTAAEVPFTPAGNILSVNVQAAIAELDSWTPKRYPSKGKRVPYIIILTGQSNAVGIWQLNTADMPINTKIKSWSATGQSGLPAAFSFITADPARTLTPTYSNSAMITGLRGSSGGAFAGEPHGNIGWFCANDIADSENTDVYIISVAWSGEPISRWEPTTGACYVELLAQVTEAMGDIQAIYPTAVGPDLVIWMQGESDRSRPPQDYVDDWVAFKEAVEGEWAVKDYTHWIVCDMAEGNYSSATGGLGYRWQGFDLLMEQTGNDVSFVSSEGASALFDVAWHYLGDGLRTMGKRCAAIALGHLATKTTSAKLVQDIEWRYGSAFSRVANGASAVGFDFNTDVALNNATAKTFRVRDNDVEKFVLGAAGVRMWSDIPSATDNNAFIFDTTNSLVLNEQIILVRNAGVPVFSIEEDGSINVGGQQGFSTQHFATNFFGSVLINRPIIFGDDVTGITGSAADGASAIGFKFSTPAYSNATAKLFSIFNGVNEKAFFDKDGGLSLDGAITAVGGSVSDLTLTTPTLIGEMDGTGSIAIAGNIGTSGNMTAGNLTCAAGTVSAQNGDFGTIKPTVKYLTSISDGAAAIGHRFDLPSWANATAMCASFENAGADKLRISKDGHIIGPSSNATLPVVIKPATSVATTFEFRQFFGIPIVDILSGNGALIQANMADAAGTAFTFVNTVTLSGTDRHLVGFKNNASVVCTISRQGAPGFWSTTPPGARVTGGTANNTPSTTGSGALTINNTSLWNGGSGTGYSIGDIVKALKDIGILA